VVQTGRRHYVTGEEWIICLLLSPVNFVGTFCDFGTRRTDIMIRACLCYGVMHVVLLQLEELNFCTVHQFGRSQSIHIGNSFFHTVEQFKYLVTTITNQNSAQEEIKGSLKSGNACFHSVRNVLRSGLVTKF
jgi:hypothetical protein